MQGKGGGNYREKAVQSYPQGLIILSRKKEKLCSIQDTERGAKLLGHVRNAKGVWVQRSERSLWVDTEVKEGLKGPEPRWNLYMDRQGRVHPSACQGTLGSECRCLRRCTWPLVLLLGWMEREPSSPLQLGKRIDVPLTPLPKPSLQEEALNA